jgi:hypothetical protein
MNEDLSNELKAEKSKTAAISEQLQLSQTTVKASPRFSRQNHHSNFDRFSWAKCHHVGVQKIPTKCVISNFIQMSL